MLSIINELANTSSKNEKIAILSKHKDNKLLKEVLLLTLNPTINFYIKKIPKFTSISTKYTLTKALHLLPALSSRIITGKDAIQYLTEILENLSSDDAEILSRIISRDLRAGIQETTVNKVWKGLIPEFPYMRCSLPKEVKLDQYSWKSGVYSQLKADGMYVNINYYNDSEIEILSRSGSSFPLDQFSDLISNIKKLKLNTQSHGELLVKRDGEILPRQISNGILNSILKGGIFADNEVPIYYIWDQIDLNNSISKGSYNIPYKERYETVLSQITDLNYIEMIPTRLVYNLDQAMEHYREMLSSGLEGTIIKDANGIWKDGKSKHQCKLKLEKTIELRVIGFNEGKGKNVNTFGSIKCQSECGLLEVNISGFTDDMRQKIWDNYEFYIGKIMEVKANAIMYSSENTHSLFLPRFVEWREDRVAADDMSRIIAIFAEL